MGDSLVGHTAQGAGPTPRLPLALRLGFIVVASLAIWIGIPRMTAAWWGGEMSLPRHMAHALGVVLLAVPLVVLTRRYIDRRSLTGLGLHSGVRALRDAAYGLIIWLLPASLGLTTAWLLGWVEVQIHDSLGTVVFAVVLLIVLVFLYEAFPEELIFRGYLYRNLSAVLRPWVAVVVQAVLFAIFGTALWVIGHGWEVVAERFPIFFAMAIVVGFLRLISGSVWAAIGFHCGFQVMMQLVLASHYADIEVNNEDAFTLATAVVAFCAASTVAGWLWRGSANWSIREPDLH